MSGVCGVHNHHFSDNVHADIAKNLREFFPEDGDITYEEFLHHQESVYQSLKTNRSNKNISSDYSQPTNNGQSSARGAASLHVASFESQQDLEEALARSLQEFERVHLSEHSGAAPDAETRTSTPQPIPLQAARDIRQGNVNPDNMSYEEMQNLGDAIGHVSKGLPDGIISRLPNFKYKTGFFSKKRITDECVICCAGYKNGARLITLPCAHLYHAECITRWLKENKNCPICKANVQVTGAE